MEADWKKRLGGNLLKSAGITMLVTLIYIGLHSVGDGTMSDGFGIVIWLNTAILLFVGFAYFDLKARLVDLKVRLETKEDKQD